MSLIVQQLGSFHICLLWKVYDTSVQEKNFLDDKKVMWCNIIVLYGRHQNICLYIYMMKLC